MNHVLTRHDLPEKCFTKGWKECEFELKQLNHLNFLITKNTFIRPQTGRNARRTTEYQRWIKENSQLGKHKYFNISSDGFCTPENKKSLDQYLKQPGCLKPDPLTFENGNVLDKNKYGPFTKDMKSYMDWITAPTTHIAQDVQTISFTQKTVWRSMTVRTHSLPHASMDVPIYQTNHRQVQILYHQVGRKAKMYDRYRVDTRPNLRAHGVKNKFESHWLFIENNDFNVLTKKTGRILVTQQKPTFSSSKWTFWDTRLKKRLKHQDREHETCNGFMKILMDLPANWPDYLYLVYKTYCFKICSMLGRGRDCLIFECRVPNLIAGLKYSSFRCVGKDTLVFDNGSGLSQLTLSRYQTSGFVYVPSADELAEDS